MAVWLIFGAMAHHRHGSAFGQLLEQTEGEFLAVIFDGAIAAVNGATFKQFVPVTTSELGPGNLSIQHRAQQSFAGTKVGHPNIVAGGGQATAAKAGGQNPESIFGRFHGAEDGFGFDHRVKNFKHGWDRMNTDFYRGEFNEVQMIRIMRGKPSIRGSAVIRILP